MDALSVQSPSEMTVLTVNVPGVVQGKLAPATEVFDRVPDEACQVADSGEGPLSESCT